MAKKLFWLFCLVLALAPAYGQDIITRSDGVVIKARVLEMSPSLIRFKLFQQPDTGVYQISTQDVQVVRLADGSTKSFTPAAAAAPFNYYTGSGRNLLWFYPIDLLFSNFTLAYERVLNSGKVGFKIPLTIGLSSANPQNNYYNSFRENSLFGTGLEVNIYPFGQGRFQFFLGPAFAFRSYQSYYYSYAGPQPAQQRRNGEMYALALKTGIYYQFTNRFIISGDTGLGFRFLREPDLPDNYYENRAYIPGNLHLGFRF
jgi:hypothetical protein